MDFINLQKEESYEIYFGTYTINGSTEIKAEDFMDAVHLWTNDHKSEIELGVLLPIIKLHWQNNKRKLLHIHFNMTH